MSPIFHVIFFCKLVVNTNNCAWCIDWQFLYAYYEVHKYLFYCYMQNFKKRLKTLYTTYLKIEGVKGVITLGNKLLRKSFTIKRYHIHSSYIPAPYCKFRIPALYTKFCIPITYALPACAKILYMTYIKHGVFYFFPL